MTEIAEPLSLTPHEDIAACTNAIGALSEYDIAMLDEEEREIVRQIRLMVLYIIHIGIKEIYTANFYGEESSQDSTPEAG